MSVIGASTVTGIAPALAGSSRNLLSQDKFYPDGRVAPFRGNTIICHLPQQGENSGFFDALLDIYRETPRHGFARKLTMLPPSSYHMTVFVGANDRERTPGLWPEGVSLDAPIEECDRTLADRLRAAPIGDLAPIRMRVNPAEPAPGTRPLALRLLPLDEAEDRKLRALRDRLSDILRIRAPDHDRYRFHTTLAYQIEPLSSEEQADFLASMSRWQRMVADRAPVLSLGQPEYCVLNDMFAFKRQFYA